MNKMTPQQYQGVRDRADLLIQPADVEAALDRMAAQITAHFADKDPLILCVMTGGIVTTGLLLPRLDFALRLDYIHASRYRGDTSGGELRWNYRPSESIRGEHVIVVDDIFDEGITMTAIVDACKEDGAASLYSAVLTAKDRDRATEYRPDVVGLTLPDRYVMGYGLDYKGYFRNASGIFAASGKDI
ncbi:MAG TPA: hypoxanthine-guanine phosphoribosyltransferase [Chromatiaceae bacterium]|nr:MAG: hypoxanthine-guanine phosphoribosyltransferase [Thiohalocapsa sp. PB-PSB1]HBG95362.1 hypoxanthine-guanine phosphoribosyltransferase [Chromatiaceae bacterium]HCS92383.1 hypoxanthine-guanine phosphoribosyltransferase [Chromatiaceae bacterium]